MDNIYSAYHYACKTKADKEAVEQIYEEVKKSAQTAIYRNIGDIFFTARTDTEINGAVECNGGTYSTADFEGKQNVGNLLASGSLPYVSLSEYESLVSANGSCRAFGWDGGDSFRVPTIPALLLTKEQSAVVGNGMTLGLTNGSINYGLNCGVSSNNQALGIRTDSYGSNLPKYYGEVGESVQGAIGVTTDPEKSGIVANLDVIEYRAMVQLANGATDQAVITATSALQQIANKVDKTSTTDRETVVGWGMPDYSAGVSISNKVSFTAPSDGYIVVSGFGSTGANSDFYINGVSIAHLGYNTNTYSHHVSSFLVNKGDVFNVSYSGSLSKGTFYPLKGVK
jgi:hypothetical protein